MIRIMKKQSLYLIGYISIILVIIGLHSCEYESNDINYVELDKPDGYFGLLVPPFSVQMVPLTFLCLGLLKDHLQS